MPTLAPSRERLRILGVAVDVVTLSDTLGLIDSFVAEGTPHQVITANALMILAAQSNPELMDAFSAADLVVPDSAGVDWAARRLGRPLPQKVPGVELVEHLCRRATAKGWNVYFLGAAPGVAAQTSVELRRNNPGLRVSGAVSGYFSEQQEADVIRNVVEASPDLLFVALNVPRQEIWLRANLPRLKAKVVIGVGGSFDVISGRLRRAPRWMQMAGLEWLYRLCQEPRRIGRMLGLPVFAWKVLRARV